MAPEFRERVNDGAGGDKLDFVGGKRNLIAQKSEDVAIGKLDKETVGALRRDTIAAMRRDGFPLVHWSARSKYVLHLYELTDELDADVDIRTAGKEGAKRLEWISRSQLGDARFQKVEIHEFAVDMVQSIIECNVMGKLEALFDVARRGNRSSDPVPQAPSSTFDVLSALRITAKAARPDSAPLPASPSWRQMMDAVGKLHASDADKLRLRFHPDRLQRELGRVSTTREMEAATKAMQLVNLLLGDPAGERSAMAALAELQVLVRPEPASDAAEEELADLLNKVRIGKAA
ncbi:hypothetical protein DFJ74DRAFT_394157 [Hyaloraphidium curvatum]|nr:hypothetical protein DFJ74DRAFT_394157 [Hyaloraphidium curvatum]